MFFAVPVVLMLLFNIVALVRVLVAVRRVRKVSLTLLCFNILQLTYLTHNECSDFNFITFEMYCLINGQECFIRFKTRGDSRVFYT